MAEVIDITVSAKVRNGLSISFSIPLDIEAYGKLNVDIAKGETKTIPLLPSGTTAVRFLLIKSSQYDEKISYRVNGAGTKIIVDTPQNFIGTGSVDALVSSKVPESLVFKNGLEEDINIQILVGRDPPS